MQNRKIKIMEFHIFKLVKEENFNLNKQFRIFIQILPREGISDLKQKKFT